MSGSSAKMTSRHALHLVVEPEDVVGHQLSAPAGSSVGSGARGISDRVNSGTNAVADAMNPVAANATTNARQRPGPEQRGRGEADQHAGEDQQPGGD